MLQELMKNISEADMVLIAVGKETETLDLSGQDMFEKSAEFYRESFAELLQAIPEQTTSQQTKAFSKKCCKEHTMLIVPGIILIRK